MKKNNAALDGLRGAAALLVVLYHAHPATELLGFTRNGYLAVDLFFVLSGFVIATAYGGALTDAGALRVFMVRRFGRIWPAHIATLLLAYAVANIATLYAGNGARLSYPSVPDAVALVTLSQGLVLHVGNGVDWSASDEFYVYVLFGVLCVTLRGKARVAAFAAFAVVGYALAGWVAVGRDHCIALGHCFSMTYGYGWTRCLAGFFAGALIAQYWGAGLFRALRGPVAQVVTLAAAVAFILRAHLISGLALAAPFVFVPVVASLAEDRGPVAALFNARPFQYLGRVSYSLYMGHAVLKPSFSALTLNARSPEVRTLIIAAFVTVSLMLAHVLYERIEAPCRARFYRWSMRFRRDAPREAAVN